MHVLNMFIEILKKNFAATETRFESILEIEIQYCEVITRVLYGYS